MLTTGRGKCTRLCNATMTASSSTDAPAIASARELQNDAQENHAEPTRPLSIRVRFEDGEETGVLAGVDDDDAQEDKYWRFEEVHGVLPRAKVLLGDGGVLFVPCVPEDQEGLLVDEDGDLHEYRLLSAAAANASPTKGASKPVLEAVAPPARAGVTESSLPSFAQHLPKGDVPAYEIVPNVKVGDDVVGLEHSVDEALCSARPVRPSPSDTADRIASPTLTKASGSAGDVEDEREDGGRKDAVQIEQAKTSRGVCRKCGEKILKGSLRCGLDAFSGGRTVTQWSHALCFLEGLSVDVCTAKRGKCKGSGEAFKPGDLRVTFAVGCHRSFWLPLRAAQWTSRVFASLRGLQDGTDAEARGTKGLDAMLNATEALEPTIRTRLSEVLRTGIDSKASDAVELRRACAKDSDVKPAPKAKRQRRASAAACSNVEPAPTVAVSVPAPRAVLDLDSGDEGCNDQAAENAGVRVSFEAPRGHFTLDLDDDDT
eukprot:TRINITY_DN20702_c0_g1_i2.p1 TRINITY_DN20702_c0_g1~~TRINITY_DN20702_c0_g1_i2.p1  ORF type:complete len:486 (+),score=79.76 TRINITY_DN20702_c0_g1_i2:1170-2627(+)